MNATSIIAVFDIGKTNKKLFIFDRQYQLLLEDAEQFPELTDEDGFPCENLPALRAFIFQSLSRVLEKKQWKLEAVNFSAYGASLVYLDGEGKLLTPMYNYLKEFPVELEKRFYDAYGGKEEFCLHTHCPALGNLNAGLQIYRLKHTRPDLFNRTKAIVFLPQYLSSLLTDRHFTEMTSIGCHTGLWDFTQAGFHGWTKKEEVLPLLPPLAATGGCLPVQRDGHHFISGMGIHDSSAALVPYLMEIKEPFLLVSTGTWNISLNPFREAPLTLSELHQDCLSYINFQGVPVRASRLFAGYEHEQATRLLAARYGCPVDAFKLISFNPSLYLALRQKYHPGYPNLMVDDLHFSGLEEAYHALIFGLVKRQVASSQLVLKGAPIKKIFVDGGFSQNQIFMEMLATEMGDWEVFAATVPQGSALGAALVMENCWNPGAIHRDLISFKRYFPSDPFNFSTKNDFNI